MKVSNQHIVRGPSRAATSSASCSASGWWKRPPAAARRADPRHRRRRQGRALRRAAESPARASRSSSPAARIDEILRTAIGSGLLRGPTRRRVPARPAERTAIVNAMVTGEAVARAGHERNWQGLGLLRGCSLHPRPAGANTPHASADRDLRPVGILASLRLARIPVDPNVFNLPAAVVGFERDNLRSG